MILDLGLPDVDGTQVLSMLRAVSDVPVIIASARDDDPSLVGALDAAEHRTVDKRGLHVNLAVGYGGRKEITDAMRSIVAAHHAEGRSLEDLAERLTPDLIGEHLYTGGQPDPDLVIRTSGEQRLSGFLMWQSAHSEFYFCEALWPDFRKVDFIRALRSHGQRERRFGG